MNTATLALPRRPFPRLSWARLVNTVEIRPDTSSTYDAKDLLARARRGKPVVLGTSARPFEHTAFAGEQLAALAAAEPTTVRVVAASPAVLAHLPRLAALDRRHAIAVDLVWTVDSTDDEHADCLGPLAAEGLYVRCLLTAGRGTSTSALAREVRAVVAAGAVDVAVHRGPRALRRAIGLLRLRYGLPRCHPGRG